MLDREAGGAEGHQPTPSCTFGTRRPRAATGTCLCFTHGMRDLARWARSAPRRYRRGGRPSSSATGSPAQSKLLDCPRWWTSTRLGAIGPPAQRLSTFIPSGASLRRARSQGSYLRPVCRSPQQRSTPTGGSGLFATGEAGDGLQVGTRDQVAGGVLWWKPCKAERVLGRVHSGLVQPDRRMPTLRAALQ